MVENDQPPKELQFFYGGQNKEFVEKLDQFGLDEDSKKCLDYFQSDEFKSSLQQNEIYTHIEKENFFFFFDNVNSGESL